MQNRKKVQKSAEALKALLPQGFSPVLGVVCGTGLGNLAVAVQNSVHIPYEELPGFPPSTVDSHMGEFVAGFLDGVPALLMRGRCHLYEGRSPEEIVMGVRVMHTLGVGALVITNAAGALNPLFDAGSLMLMDDHINLTGQSPLTGANTIAWGPRFPDMSRAYDPDMGQVLQKTALARGLRLERGVYACVPGPQLETRAETRALRILGADAVGMSTVLEVIAAHHMGMRVLGVSCLTNKNLPDCMAEATLEEMIAIAENTGAALAGLIEASAPELARLI